MSYQNNNQETDDEWWKTKNILNGKSDLKITKKC